MSTASSGSPRRGILFVCHANICRSPLAQGLFLHHAAARGVAERFEVDSAGTWASEGNPPHPGSVDAARRHGIDVAGLGAGSRSIVPDDLQRFELIVAMDRRNLSDLERLRRLSAFGAGEGGQARMTLLRRLVDPRARGHAADVPDPVRGGPEQFEAAYRIIDAGCVALFEALLSAH